MAYYDGNSCALSLIGEYKSTGKLEDEQIEMLVEEIVQLRTFINTHHPENKLPVETSIARYELVKPEDLPTRATIGRPKGV